MVGNAVYSRNIFFYRCILALPAKSHTKVIVVGGHYYGYCLYYALRRHYYYWRRWINAAARQPVAMEKEDRPCPFLRLHFHLSFGGEFIFEQQVNRPQYRHKGAFHYSFWR